MRSIHLRQSRSPQAREPNVIVVVLDDAAPTEIPEANVLVVAPALNSRLRHWLSDEDSARRRARERMTAWVDALERRGVLVAGRVGDADPLQAIADALPAFPADEIVIVGEPEASARFVDKFLARAQGRFSGPAFRAGRSLPEAA